MRSLIVYESIFGNTRAVAQAIADALADWGPAQVVEVAEAPSTASGFDLVVVGGPIHAWGMTSAMTRAGARDEARKHGVEPVSRGIGLRDWLEKLAPASPGQYAAAFDTAVHVPFFIPQGSAAKPADRRFEALGFAVVAEPEHFFVADKEGPVEPGELERARGWARGLAERIAQQASAGPIAPDR